MEGGPAHAYEAPKQVAGAMASTIHGLGLGGCSLVGEPSPRGSLRRPPSLGDEPTVLIWKEPRRWGGCCHPVRPFDTPILDSNIVNTCLGTAGGADRRPRAPFRNWLLAALTYVGESEAFVLSLCAQASQIEGRQGEDFDRIGWRRFSGKNGHLSR